MKGNTALSVSIVIVTALVAPFTVPLLFWLIKFKNLSINPALILKDMAIIVFLPLIFAQIIKKYVPMKVSDKEPLFTSINILLLFLLVYGVISYQHDVILSDTANLVRQLVMIYAIFILLHVVGYLAGYKQSKKNRIAIAVGKSYMNNGMAIVLAASHFDPSVLVFMVLSEIPWNTLLGPFKRILRHL